MRDRIGELAARIRQENEAERSRSEREAAAKREGESAESSQRLRNIADMEALAQRFYDWTRRHGIPAESRRGAAEHPAGWLLGFGEEDSGEWGANSRYGLLLRANGKLVNTVFMHPPKKFGRDKCWYKPRNEDNLTYFSIYGMEEEIARIVARYGVEWG